APADPKLLQLREIGLIMGQAELQALVERRLGDAEQFGNVRSPAAAAGGDVGVAGQTAELLADGVVVEQGERLHLQQASDSLQLWAVGVQLVVPTRRGGVCHKGLFVRVGGAGAVAFFARMPSLL